LIPEGQRLPSFLGNFRVHWLGYQAKKRY